MRFRVSTDLIVRGSLLFVVRSRISIDLSWLLVVVHCEITQRALVIVAVATVVVVVMTDVVVEMVVW